MRFYSEQNAIEEIGTFLLESSASLFKATKYIYGLSYSDFYHCSIKDVFKIILNNLTKADMLQALGLNIQGDACTEMENEEYSKVFALMVYSFAVRLPTLQRFQMNGERITDAQVQKIYEFIIGKGVVNYDNVVTDNYTEIRQHVRKKQPIPPYSADWYTAFVYTHIPELAEINNRNMFFFGTIDVLFMMFYMRLEEEMQTMLASLSVKTAKLR